MLALSSYIFSQVNFSQLISNLIKFPTDSNFRTAFLYYYWSYLMQDIRRLDCLTFLFIPKIEDLCKHYNIELEPTQQFLRQAKLIRFFMYILMFGLEVIFAIFVIRCLAISYLEIEFQYFLCLSVPLRWSLCSQYTV